MKIKKKQLRKRRHLRIKAKIKGTLQRPRLSVFRSLNHIYAQLIDDEAGRTLVAVSDRNIKDSSGKTKGTKTEIAKKVGLLLAEKAKQHKITKVVFDRGGFKYHGRIKAVAEGAREGGLQF